MSTVTEIRVPEPLVPVQSRVSWGALLAGAVVAVAVYSLLSMLGIAVGFTVSDSFNPEQLGTGAAIWSFVTLLIAMFFGGYVATRCTAGELRSEAILYGIIVWAVTSSILIPLTAAGIGVGTGTALADRGVATTNDSMVPPMINSTRITAANESRNRDNSSDSNSSRSSSASERDQNSKATSESGNSNTISPKMREYLRAATWWGFAGTLLSMLAAVGGALVGPHVVITHRKYVTGRVPA